MTQQNDVKNVQIQIYLLVGAADEPREAIRTLENAPLIYRDLLPPLEGILVTKQSRRQKPQWSEFLEDAVKGTLDELQNSSASAVLILRAGERLFALTYGYGRSLLDPALIERRFGLRVALNAIDPTQLRAVDSRTVEEMTFHTRRQASRISEVSAFGLDTARDLLRGITGIPREGLGATRISGSESVTLSVPVKPADLPDTCAQLLELYAGEQYRERFEWIDRLQLVRDQSIRADLDGLLSAALQHGEADNMHLAPPEAVDWQNVSGFYYWNPDVSGRHEDLDISDALEELTSHARHPLTAEYLRKHHVYLEFRDSHPVAKFTFYSAMVFEAQVDGRLYVLSDAEWHEIDLDWAQSIRDEVAAIEPATLQLPPAEKGEIERIYNTRAGGILGAQVFDRCMVRYGPSRDQIEFCDLLTSERQLIHVKRKIQSATLSHLFMQGQNSAQLFVYDKEFRAAVHKAASDAGLTLDVLPSESINPAEWEVVFAIIAKPNRRWPDSLPFFSQLSLAAAANALDRMGFRKSLAQIPVGAD